MDEKKDRILQIRDYFCNGNNREFAKKLNMSEQYASNMTHGKKTFRHYPLGTAVDLQGKHYLEQVRDVFLFCCFWRASNLPTFAHVVYSSPKDILNTVSEVVISCFSDNPFNLAVR